MTRKPTTYTEYANSCIDLGIYPSRHEFLLVDSIKPTESDKRLMRSMVDICELVEDLIQDPEFITPWMDRPLKQPPFHGKSPREFILSRGRTGVYEVKLFLGALKVYVSNGMRDV